MIKVTDLVRKCRYMVNLIFFKDALLLPSSVYWGLQDLEKPVKVYVNYKSNRA